MDPKDEVIDSPPEQEAEIETEVAVDETPAPKEEAPPAWAKALYDKVDSLAALSAPIKADPSARIVYDHQQVLAEEQKTEAALQSIRAKMASDEWADGTIREVDKEDIRDQRAALRNYKQSLETRKTELQHDYHQSTLQAGAERFGSELSGKVSEMLPDMPQKDHLAVLGAAMKNPGLAREAVARGKEAVKEFAVKYASVSFVRGAPPPRRQQQREESEPEHDTPRVPSTPRTKELSANEVAECEECWGFKPEQAGWTPEHARKKIAEYRQLNLKKGR